MNNEMVVPSHRHACDAAWSSGTPPNGVAGQGQYETDQDGSSRWARTHLKETWDGFVPPPARVLELFFLPELCHTTSVSAHVSASQPTTETRAQQYEIDTPASFRGPWGTPRYSPRLCKPRSCTWGGLFCLSSKKRRSLLQTGLHFPSLGQTRMALKKRIRSFRSMWSGLRSSTGRAIRKHKIDLLQLDQHTNTFILKQKDLQ